MKQLLYVTWRDPESNAWFPVGRVEFDGELYSFCYTQGVEQAKATKKFPGLPQFVDPFRPYHSVDLFPFLHNRVISRKRGDYAEHLLRMGFDPGDLAHSVHAFDVLERSNGRRLTDRFEVFAPPQVKGGTATFVFFTRGLRHRPIEVQQRWEHEPPPRPLGARPDTHNSFDENAVMLYAADGTPIGYVPRYYSASVANLMRTGKLPVIKLLRHNPLPAPVQERILVQLEIPVPNEWEFGTEAEFKTLTRSSEDAA